MALTFGYKASAEQFGPRELLDFGILAEELEFDSVVVSDHFTPWRHHGGHAPYSFAWLGALGAKTSHVRLGTSVVTPTFRYHPAIVAQAMATLGVLFPRRMFLGVGTGEAMNEVPPTGVQWPGFGERIGRLREAIALMRALWSREFVTFEGRYFKTLEATLYDRPAEGIPLYVAASGEKAARLAGEVADGFICTSGKGMELYRDVLLPAVESAAREKDREPSRIEKMIEVKVSYDTDIERAMRDTREWAALALPGEEKAGTFDPREMEKRAAAVADRAHTRFIVSSDPDEHAAKVNDYIELGFTHLVFHFPGPDQRRALQLYSKDILPRLRSHVAVG
ncbi:MAG: glucose-6-phosphate dehydrogenase (coenzyme-F420) [Chloroflexi bacterium 13_1_40CM_4_68_4]|nr:MAG: glucose-6-phosphate dehydrogenase (coenzyme-F420) [Chloroflexi bacterium 13_1_40CM_4_68_4]